MSAPDAAVTVIISDLHLGGGAADPGDDHVYQGKPLERLLAELGAWDEGKKGQIELLINGDLFELAQVRPDLYKGGDFSTWSSEAESVARLKVILDGHAGIFAAMKRFQAAGNRVSMAAGNHDVDLYWPEVQKCMREVAGPVQFELGRTWYTRYGGRLHIAHGHMDDPANSFEDWANPIRSPEHAERRLEMCPGTVFMLRLVNVLEKDYPFVDNIKPVTALARLLWRENKKGLAAVAWLLTKFMALHPDAALSAKAADPNAFYKDFKRLVEVSDNARQSLRQAAQKAYRKPQSDDDVARLLATEKAFLDFLMDLLRAAGLEGLSQLEPRGPGTLSAHGGGGTLKIAQAGRLDEKENLARVAKQRCLAERSCQVVVMGHTHQPDSREFDGRRYYNPGSWTRYVDVSKQDALTLDMLKDESRFPYQLNYIRVQPAAHGRLASEKKTFAEDRGKPL